MTTEYIQLMIHNFIQQLLEDTTAGSRLNTLAVHDLRKVLHSLEALDVTS